MFRHIFHNYWMLPPLSYQKQRNGQYPLDEIDRRILSALQQDGRLTIAGACRPRSGCPPRPVIAASAFSKTKLNYRALCRGARPTRGLAPVSVFVSIKLESQREDALQKFAKGHRALAGDPRMLSDDRPARLSAGVVVADLAAYESFLKTKLTRLSGIGSIGHQINGQHWNR